MCHLVARSKYSQEASIQHVWLVPHFCISGMSVRAEHVGYSLEKLAIPSLPGPITFFFYCCYFWRWSLRRDTKATQRRAAVLNVQLSDFQKLLYSSCANATEQPRTLVLPWSEKYKQQRVLNCVRSALMLITVDGDSIPQGRVSGKATLQVGAGKQTARLFSSVFTSITGLLATEHKCTTYRR